MLASLQHGPSNMVIIMSRFIDIVKSNNRDDDTYHVVTGLDGSTLQYVQTVSLIEKSDTMSEAEGYVVGMLQGCIRYVLARGVLHVDDITLMIELEQ
jgi:hypothetical protein